VKNAKEAASVKPKRDSMEIKLSELEKRMESFQSEQSQMTFSAQPDQKQLSQPVEPTF